MPSKKRVVVPGRQARTVRKARGFRSLEVMRRVAAMWRSTAPFQRQILNGLQDGRPLYQGTANAKAVAKRRARNKMGRRSRRINRMRASR